MKELRLEELLRYALSGGAALAAWYLVFPYARQIVKIGSVAEATLLLSTALLLGSLVYNVYRSLMYPIILRLILLVMVLFRLFPFSRDLLLPYIPADLELRLDTWRWRSVQQDHFSKPVFPEWGAQTHFMYCSSLSIPLAFWFGRLGGAPNHQWWAHLWKVACLLALAAVVHHVRLLLVLRHLTMQEPAYMFASAQARS